MNKKLLLSFEEYSAIDYEHPYFYSIESNEQILYYFGAEHTKDVSHLQFEILHAKWQDFLGKTKSKKRVVFFEGKLDSEQLITLEESIKKYGESGTIVFWANQSNVTSHRPEPDIKIEIEKLLTDFSKDEIFYFYIARAIGHWQHGMVMRKDFDEFINFNMERYRTVLDWQDFVFSFETFKRIHKQIFGEELDLNDKNLFRKITNPAMNRTVFNEIAKKSSTIRNIFILEQIEEKWKEGYSIFVVYGSGHAVMQEGVIKSLVGKNERM